MQLGERPELSVIFVLMKDFCNYPRFTILLTCIVFGSTLLTAQTTSVLWLGNSYVATNNLPDMLAQLALSGGDTIQYDSNTPGGYTFQLHWDDAYTHSKINQQSWDFVVLQAQSQEPSLDSAYVSNNVFPYARALDSVIHVNDSCTQTIFYMTWGRKNGDAQNCASYPPVCTYQGMQDQLRNRYLQMGYDNNAIVAPCGEAWRDVIAATPAFDLYMADESHPSLYGSYLNACVFYASIFRRSPVGLSYYGGLPAADAQFLQLYAADCVLDSMLLWNTEVYYDKADFAPQLTSGSTYLFSASTAGTIHQWNFGSGFVPGSANEVFTFPGNGTYYVTHVTDNGCRTDTSSQWITVGPQGVWNCIPGKGNLVYPVPADAWTTILNPFPPTGSCTVEVYDAAGRMLSTTLESGESFFLNTAELADGIYSIRLIQNRDEITQLITVCH